MQTKYRDFDIDKIISDLLAFQTTEKSLVESNYKSLKTLSKPNKSKVSSFNQHNIEILCELSKEIFRQQPILLELTAPLVICGDVHGQFTDLIRIFEKCGYPPHSNYLFLGDYVDRGKQSLETICLLLAYKIKYPENFFLLRGNHECASINRIYGFYDECQRRFDLKLWKDFTDMFNYLPVAALINDRIFCMHGGIPRNLEKISHIHQILRPTDIPDKGILCDLLWADPSTEFEGWRPNDRGVSFTFGKDIVAQFKKENDIDLICRAHQVVEDGYEFFAKRSLVTIFSAPNYCDDFGNSGGMVIVDDELLCSFKVIEAEELNALEEENLDPNRNIKVSRKESHKRDKGKIKQRASTPPKLFTKNRSNNKINDESY